MRPLPYSFLGLTKTQTSDKCPEVTVADKGFIENNELNVVICLTI